MRINLSSSWHRFFTKSAVVTLAILATTRLYYSFDWSWEVVKNPKDKRAIYKYLPLANQEALDYFARHGTVTAVQLSPLVEDNALIMQRFYETLYPTSISKKASIVITLKNEIGYGECEKLHDSEHISIYEC